MNAIKNERNGNETSWQSSFVDMMTEIKRRFHLAFCRLEPEAREDAIAEGVVHSFLAYIRLHKQGRSEVATPSSLVWYSSRHVKRGRPAAGRMNSKEPLSRYAQLGRGIQVERLDRYSKKRDEWIDTMVEDKRASVADQLAAKLDVDSWFETLTKRTKQIARDLAFGFSTSEVAKKHGVTAGRMSQLRRSLEESWAAFQGERVVAIAQ
jgi:hypothetical protein